MTRDYFYEIELSLASYAWAETVQVLRYNLLETDAGWQDSGNARENRLFKRDLRLSTTAYSFHWQDQYGNLIRRWDNAPHFHDLNGFPHHIHIGESDTVVPGKPITALEMLAKIDAELCNSL